MGRTQPVNHWLLNYQIPALNIFFTVIVLLFYSYPRHSYGKNTFRLVTN
jgi:hypothetical protein